MGMLTIKQLENNLQTLQKMYRTEPHRTELRECLEEVRGYEGGDQAEYLRGRTAVVSTLISLLECAKVPQLVVEMLHGFVVSDMLDRSDVLALIGRLGTQTWSGTGKVKVLQMAFYFVRYDLYSGDEAFQLLRFVFDCMDMSDPGLDAAARPVAVLLLDKLLRRAVPLRDESRCDLQIRNRTDHDECIDDDRDRECINGDKDNSNKDIADRDNKGLLAVQRYSKSQEEIRPPAESDAHYGANIVNILDFIGSQIQSKGMYNLCCVLSQIVKCPGIYELEGVEAFVRTRMGRVLQAVLKHGRAEDKEAAHSIVLKLEQFDRDRAGEMLDEFYAKLQKVYDEHDEGFFRFVLGVLRIVAGRHGGRFAEETEVPAPLLDIFERVLAELNVAKKSHSPRFDYAAGVLALHSGDSPVFCRAVDGILRKLEDAKEVNIGVDRFVSAALETTAKCGSTALFERLLAIASVDTLLSAAVALRRYMKDSWFIVATRSTDAQRRAALLPRLAEFDAEELAYFIKYAPAAEMGPVFDSALHVLTDDCNILLLENLLGRVADFETLSGIVVRYYGHIQTKTQPRQQAGNSVECKQIGEQGIADISDGSDPAVNSIANLSISQPLFHIVNASPLIALKSFVASHPEHYQQALTAVSQIVRTVDPADLWHTVFDIIDLQRDSIDQQVSILLSICENSLGSLADHYITKILGILKKMAQSADSNTCLNALFIYQEVGEFLATRNLLRHGSLVIPQTAKTEEPTEEPTTCLWKEFVITGAVLMRDKRPFVPISMAKYLLAFISSSYAFFSNADFDFIERLVFRQMLDASSTEVTSFVLDELNAYSQKFSLRSFRSPYMAFLADLLFHTDRALAQRAYEGLAHHLSEIYHSLNYVICDNTGPDSPTSELIEESSRLSTPAEEQGSGFVIKMKKSIHLDSQITAVFSKFIGILVEKDSAFAPQLLHWMAHFSYSEPDIDRFTTAFYQIIQRPNIPVKEIINCIDGIHAVSGIPDRSLLLFASWLNDPQLASIPLSDASPLSFLLLTKLGEGMAKAHSPEAFRQALAAIHSFAFECSAERAIDAVIRGGQQIDSLTDMHIFLGFIKELLSDDRLFISSRIRERKLIELISFYHSVLKTYHELAAEQHGRSLVDGSPYAVLLLCTAKPYQNLMLRAYQILFADMAHCSDLLQAHIRRTFQQFIDYFLSSGRAIHNSRVGEIVYILRCLIRHNSADFIGELKYEIANLLVTCDPSITELVRQCVHIIFDQIK